LPQFTEVTRQAGITHGNTSGSALKKYVLETQSAGVGLWDYDMDGDLDLFFTNGEPPDEQDDGASRGNVLYENSGDGTFADVTDRAAVGRPGWNMGCAMADYDSDGDPDLYVTRWGANALFRNEGRGRFSEVGTTAGVANEGWGVGGAFGDADGDGDPDLYVANYIEFQLHGPPFYDEWCTHNGIPSACGPKGFAAQHDVLYRNNGDGTFADVSQAAGVRRRAHYGMGMVWGDLDNDRDLDIYVANDGHPNSLFRNDGNGRFVDIAPLTGTAYSSSGRSQASMGVALGDYDNDGHLDILVTNFSQDHNTLYRNEGSGWFADVTGRAGMGGASRPFMGWGTFFFDFDHDGYLDVFVANGHLMPAIDRAGVGLSYKQRNLLFRNTGEGRFEDVSAVAGSGLRVEKVSRGAAFGDLDNDGDLDVVVANMDAAPTLLRNDGGNRRSSLMLKLAGTSIDRDAIGARVEVFADSLVQVREVVSGSSFQAQSDMRLHVGLGRRQRADSLTVRWLGGAVQSFGRVPANRLLTIVEGASPPALD